MEREKRKMLRRIAMLIMCLALVLSTGVSAFAQSTSGDGSSEETTTIPTESSTQTPEASPTDEDKSSNSDEEEQSKTDEEESTAKSEENYGIINGAELTKMVESFLGKRGISTKNFSLGFCYTATGDTWYYNGDQWFYPASVYKVPLMMLVSEKVKAGELTQESDIEGLTVAEIEEYVLVYSNNDWAHKIRTYLGGDETWRKEAMAYSTLDEDEFSSDYLDYCYFSNRYITEVMKTLYNEPERFPNITDMLLKAEPNDYFRLSMEGKYEIAQKYGSFCDQHGDNFNHTTGFIYTKNPIIVTVMTLNVSDYEKVISDAAVMMKDYALTLDSKLSGYQRDLAKAEEDRIAAEKAAAEAEAEAKAEAERQAAEQAAAQQAIIEQQTLQAARKELFSKIIILVGVLAVIGAVVYLFMRTKGKKQRKERYDTYRRSYEAEQRRKASSNDKGNGYRPRH